MRTALSFPALLAALLVAAGCGSSGGGSKLVGGTISGQAFKPVEAVAIRTDAASCTVPVLGAIEARALALRFSSYTNTCADFDDPFCLLHASSQNVTVIFADLSQIAGRSALAAGTYTLNPNPTVVQPQTSGPLAGTALVAFAASVTTSAACVPSPLVAQGTLRLDQVDGTTVTGNVDLTFGHLDPATQAFTPDGSTLSGDFSATVCGNTISQDELCGLAGSGGQCTAHSGPHC
jgi:hypothetical protein